MVNTIFTITHPAAVLFAGRTTKKGMILLGLTMTNVFMLSIPDVY